MGSNHKTLRIVAGIHAFIGVIATIIGTIAGFFVNILLGFAIFVLGIFITISMTCLYYGVANIQENQIKISQALRITLDNNGGKPGGYGYEEDDEDDDE